MWGLWYSVIAAENELKETEWSRPGGSFKTGAMGIFEGLGLRAYTN